MLRKLFILFFSASIGVFLVCSSPGAVWASFAVQVTIAHNTIETKNYGMLTAPNPTASPTPTPISALLSNQLSQTFHNTGGKIGFWYNLQTSEQLTGFGEPALVVRLNNETIHQVWASDAWQEVTKDLKETGWRFLTVDLSEFPDQNLTLSFVTEKNDDPKHQSIVHIGKITTDPVEIKKAHNGAPPSTISDLHVYDDGHNNVTFAWTGPRDGSSSHFDQVAEYDLRYSTVPIVADINEDEWQSLPQVPVSFSENLFHIGVHAPVSAGNPEMIEARLNDTVEPWWFAVRSKNQSGIFSKISNIAKLDLSQPSMHLQSIDQNHVSFFIQNFFPETQLSYLLEYDHRLNGVVVHEALTGTLQTLPSQTEIFSPSLFLGTCSEAGVVCAPHQEITHIALTITFTGKDGTQQTLQAELPQI